jgi:hypothetical protein
MTPRHLFILLFLVGIALCSRGIGKVAANGDWLSPFAFAGYFLGAAAIILFVLVIAGKLPFIANDKQAMAVLAGIIIIKLLIGIVYASIRK